MLQLKSLVPSSSALLSSADLEETLEAARRQHLLNVNAPDAGIQVIHTSAVWFAMHTNSQGCFWVQRLPYIA